MTHPLLGPNLSGGGTPALPGASQVLADFSGPELVGGAVHVSVVVPTRNEAGNVAALLRRLAAATADHTVEVIFVDDSDDDTPDIVVAEAANSPLAVRLIHRPVGQREGGLGGAVLAGFRDALAPWAVVMDGDLQHPPEALPDLLAATRAPGVDAVVGSRYTGQGDASGLGGRWRTSVSDLCTRLAKVVFPGRLRGVSDPMSGFFAVRLDALDLERLHPRGYKVLLEVLTRSRLRETRDVRYCFQARFSGESKASLREGLVFLRRLIVLRLVAFGTGWSQSHHGEVSAGRLSPLAFAGHAARLVVPLGLLALAFPDLSEHSWRTISTGSSSPGVLGAVFLVLALTVGRTRPGRQEPDVHDRQLDAILGVWFLAMAMWLTLHWPVPMDSAAAPTTREIVAVVLFLFGAALLVLGTRATARLKFALLVPLLGVPALTPHWRAAELTVALLVAGGALRSSRLRGRSGGDGVPPAGVRPHVWPRARYAAVAVCAVAAMLGGAALTKDAGAAAQPAPAGTVSR